MGGSALTRSVGGGVVAVVVAFVVGQGQAEREEGRCPTSRGLRSRTTSTPRARSRSPAGTSERRGGARRDGRPTAIGRTERRGSVFVLAQDQRCGLGLPPARFRRHRRHHGGRARCRLRPSLNRGSCCYGLKRPDLWPGWFGFHEVFHALTIAGFAAHYAAVFLATA
ncbi:hemolysin III family protein [Streptomyces sp. CFMR 7]|uniref:hemolysin III family protein n=1 Tax=Streptomyces sp. CFMR 7 TaxID=1649184 RepID=UPI0037DA0214